MEAARAAGVLLALPCGGRGTCGRCKVRVISGERPAVADIEKRRLSVEEIATGVHLACAARVFDDLTVEIPTQADVQRIQLSGKGIDLVPDAVIAAYEMAAPESAPPVPPAGGWKDLQGRMQELHGLENLRADPAVVQDHPPVTGAVGRATTVLVRGDEVIAVQPSGHEPLGMAFDVGTSTIAAYLVNLRTGENVDARGVLNPQVAYGEDVIARIRHAIEHGGGELRQSILGALNGLVEAMAGRPEDVAEVTLVGNTAMHHLALGLPVRQLGTAPYQPAVSDPLDIKAREVGLRVARGAYAYFAPNIAGFVGGDHVAFLLATGIWETARNVIGIDIGTNTEVTLAAKGVLSCLSCASGPAFEGGGVRHGMRAAEGAIEKVSIDDAGIHLKVIGDVPPSGICGSGILDLLSELRHRQIIDPRGALKDRPRVRRGTGGREFILASGETSGTGRDVVVTQRDIGEIQLAKAAVRAGIQVLLDEAGIGAHNIDEVIVGGAFGQNMNPESALGVGMFPPVPLSRITQVGNAAGLGARLVLISRRGRALAAEIARRARYVELTTHPRFSRQFSHALRFGP